MNRRIVSRHMLRRRARARLDDLVSLQVKAIRTGDLPSKLHLHRLGLDVFTKLRVVKASRGPWRWYVAVPGETKENR